MHGFADASEIRLMPDGGGSGDGAPPAPNLKIEEIPVSDFTFADLPSDEATCRVLYHKGPAKAVLGRWRATITRAWMHGWPGVQPYAASVMRMVADPRVLYLAAQQLRGRGPKAPGPNELRLEVLTEEELWNMADALATALARNTYQPGEEWVKYVLKASGTGTRPIVIMNAQDRVVQKAAAIVLRPMLDPLFDPLDFACRPWRKREHAVSVAVRLAGDGYAYWLTHDLRNAYCRVPVGRLLDVFYKLLPCPRLRDFLAKVLPPKDASVGGIKQGGPLSPLALGVHLNHFVDRPWRQLGNPVRLVRWADDLLLAADTFEDAGDADAALRKLLPAAGMMVKDEFKDALINLQEADAEWLGFRFRLTAKGVEVRLGGRSLDKLGQRLLLAHTKSQPARRAAQVLVNWIGQLGPCHEWADRPAVCREALDRARMYGFEENPSEGKLLQVWGAAAGRWAQAQQSPQASGLDYPASPLTPPCPTSVVW
jgi:hypothetical protein